MFYRHIINQLTLKASLLVIPSTLMMICFYSIAVFGYNDVNTTNSVTDKKIVIGIYDQDSLEKNAGAQLEKLNHFIQEYWQLWGLANQYHVEFISLPMDQVFTALNNKTIDVVGITTTVTNNNPKHLYSIPYAKFKQRIFNQLDGNNIDGVQLAIHASNKTTLNFLGDHIERDYFNNLDDLLANYTKYDALYSSRPWLLENKLKQLNITNQFYISTDAAPEIYFHFSTRVTDKQLMIEINEGLRNIDEYEADLWHERFFSNSNNISFTFGHYIAGLSQAEQNYIVNKNILKYPVLPNAYPPYIINKSFSNIAERGLTVDFLKHITKTTGLLFQPFYIKNIEEKHTLLNQHKYDLQTLSLEIPTPSNKSIYSIDYVESHWNITYRHQDIITDEANDLHSETLAAVKGFAITDYLQVQLPTATIKLFNTIEDAIKAVAKGDANAYIGLALNSAYIIKQEKLSNLTTVPVKGIRLSSHFTFSAHQKNSSLITLLNRSLNSLSSNDFDAIYQQWSKTVFANNNAEQQIKTVYRQVLIILIAFIVIATIIACIAYKQLKFRKTQQQKIELALSTAEQARTEAEKSAEAKINFLARMSHEIRTPMNGVFGMSEALSFTDLNTEQKSLLNTLNDSASNLLSLLNNVLDFSKMEAGKLTLEVRPVDFNELTERVLKGYLQTKNQKGLTINFNVDKNMAPFYMIDPIRITQVFNNLLSNAIKFTERGYINISIKLIKQKTEYNIHYDTLTFIFEDSGIGINAEEQSLLFNPFIQADSAVTRKFGGTGLGLSICQEIITAMDSKIFVKSSKGNGSKFHFTLTLQQAENISIRAERRSKIRHVIDPDDDKFKSLRVLIAEDNIVNIKVLTSQLARLNVHPDVAENGQQALILCEKNHYDIVISDCHMPIVDGFELASKLAQKQKNNRPWLIAITADALEDTADRCLNAGFNDYIAKPCTQAMLSNKMHHAYRQVNTSTPQALNNKNDYQYFQPDILFNANEQDLVLSKKTAQVFLEIWQKDKKLLASAMKQSNFSQIVTLTHRLISSINYLSHNELEKQALLLQHYAQTNNSDAIQASMKQFMKALDLLSAEINDWLFYEDPHKK
jgi:signal transduction histidine kinase/CheY-like chemotaxis protein